MNPRRTKVLIRHDLCFIRTIIGFDSRTASFCRSLPDFRWLAKAPLLSAKRDVFVPTPPQLPHFSPGGTQNICRPSQMAPFCTVRKQGKIILPIVEIMALLLHIPRLCESVGAVRERQRRRGQCMHADHDEGDVPQGRDKVNLEEFIFFVVRKDQAEQSGAVSGKSPDESGEPLETERRE